MLDATSVSVMPPSSVATGWPDIYMHALRIGLKMRIVNLIAKEDYASITKQTCSSDANGRKKIRS